MKILLLSRYESLGSRTRVRSLQYLPYLQAQGLQITYSPLLPNSYILDLYAGRRNFITIFKAYFTRIYNLLQAGNYDLIWIENEIMPMLPPWAESFLIRWKLPYLVDYDDAIFHNYDLHPLYLVRKFMGNKIDQVMTKAKLVITGNDYLACRAYQAGAVRVELLPSVIDLDRYQSKPQYKNKIFTIGWIGCPVTAKYLQMVRPALMEICRQGARLILVGLSDLPGYDQEFVEYRPWTYATEVHHILDFDVGIMPLPDEPWTRGKCGYKLIQYMACSLPVVASPVGVNCKIVEHGVNGFLANKTRDWVAAFKILKENNNLKLQMGLQGRSKVEKNYCIQVTAPYLLTMIRICLKKA